MKFILKKVLTKLILPPPTFSLFLTQASLYSEISEGSCNFSLLGVFTFCSPSICISSRKSCALHLPLQTVKLYFFKKKKKIITTIYYSNFMRADILALLLPSIPWFHHHASEVPNSFSTTFVVHELYTPKRPLIQYQNWAPPPSFLSIGLFWPWLALKLDFCKPIACLISFFQSPGTFGVR